MSKSDITTLLWILFWCYILTLGEPSLLEAIIEWIGRH